MYNLAIKSIVSKNIFSQIIKFGIVGASGIFIDFGLTWLLKEKLKAQKYIANSLGFIAAACSNYYLNRIWTFESTDPNILKQFSLFFFISLIGLVLNNVFLYGFHEKTKVPFYTSKLLAIGMIFFWNFFANYFFTF